MSRREHLQALLYAHPAADERERGFVEEMCALLKRPTDCFSRGHFVPGHFTASSFVLSPNEEDLLLIFHGKLHRWLQPGGHVEPEDHDIVAAAHREVAEEVGLEAHQLVPLGDRIFDVDIHEIPARKAEPAHLHLDVRILFRATTRDMRAGSDAVDARWVPLAEMEAVESDASVMRAVEKLRGRTAERSRSG